MAQGWRCNQQADLSSDYFRCLVENTLDIVAVIGAEGKLEFVSQSVEQILGYPPQDLLECDVLEIIRGDDQPVVKQMLDRAALDKGGIHEVECSVRHADGSWRPMAAVGRRVAREPSLNGIVVKLHDVSRRRAAEQALRESQRRFQDLAETVPEWLWEIDESNRYTYVSPRVREVLGYDPDDVLGQGLFEFVAPEDSERADLLTASPLASREPFDLREIVLRHKDGHPVSIETRGIPRFTDDGHFSGYRGVHRDVTEARAAQSEIEDLSRFPIENPNPVLRATPSGEVLFANDPAKALTSVVQDNRLTPQLRSLVQSAHRSNERQSFDIQCDHHTFAFFLTPVTGKPYVNLYGIEVTDIKRSQMALEASEASLEKSNRLLILIRQCNAILVRETNERALLRATCRLIAQDGHYLLAWVGYLEDNDAVSVSPVAVEGKTGDRIGDIETNWGRDESGRTIIDTAIRTNKSAIFNAISTKPADPQWQCQARQYGLASAVSIPLRDNRKVFGVLNVGSDDPEAFDADEISLLEELAGDLSYGIVVIRQGHRRVQAEAEKFRLERELESALLQTIEAVTKAAESRDPYTAGHEREVARLSRALAEELGFPAHDCEGLRVAGLLHDIGKLQIPMEILARPTQLSEVEYAVVMTHAEIGYTILKDVKFPWPIAEMILQHHERLDGSGYPRGLMGRDIVVGARILAVADTMEAMGNHRPYRPARGTDAALLQILQNRGRLFDPDVVDACFRLFETKRFTLQSD